MKPYYPRNFANYLPNSQTGVMTFFLLCIGFCSNLMAQNPSVVNTEVVSEVFNGNNLDVSIATTQILLPNGALEENTVIPANVKLFHNGTNVEITNTNVNTTGGGDAIVLTADGLDFSTTYRFEISSGVLDISGASIVPYTTTFTTTGTVPTPSGVEFTQVQATSGANYTSVAIGPDDKLYGLVNNGMIHRWDIAQDGTLSNQQNIPSLQTAEGGNRLAIHLVFDPSSTAQNLIAWVSHTTFGFKSQDDWEGKITRLSGTDLQTVQDYVIGLPRSTKDHVTNGLDFGPDGALYALQGSNSAMGAPDGTWGFRPERLLTAAVLRIDLAAIINPPVDVKTSEGGTYDPFDPTAPVTLFGTGVRNPYDLVWHSNGQLYVPTNGSAAGGNTPATPANLANIPTRIDGPYVGGVVPAINGVTQTQNDFLFRVVDGGYYGHPNPTRGEYVMNGGNPTSNSDPAQVNQYPTGTLVDQNYRGFAYNFLNNKSPNGVIEYTSNAFGGALKGKLLVVRYSGGDDIIALTPGGSNLDIINAQTGILGFTGFNNPLDLVENPSNGHIYVSEYGSGEITLLRPASSGLLPVLETDKEEVIFSGFVSPPGSLPDDVQSLVITNSGLNTLSISALAFSGTNGSDFSLTNPPTFPLDLLSGESDTLFIQFDPSQTGALNGSLDISSNDANAAVISVPLYGLGSQQFEGSNEAPMSAIIATLGYDINIGWAGLTSSITTFPLGDEVLDSVFRKAGPGNVEMLPVARYSPAFPLPFGYYEDNDDTSAPVLTTVATLESGQGGATNPDPEHQTLFPEIASGNISFDPGNIDFGFFTTSPSHTAYSEDVLNALLEPSKAEHAVRIYEMKDRNGNAVPNTYFIGFEEASNGDYQDYVFVVSNIEPASADSTPVSPPGLDLVRLNVGSTNSFTVANGDVFAPDNPTFISGTTQTNFKNFNVLNTDDDDLYLEYRFGENFTYNIPVANGTYAVRLYFAEIFQTQTGQRIFSVDVEGGQGGTTNLDLVAEVGYGTAIIKEYQNIAVADGDMSLAFSFTEDNALIQGIEIIGMGIGNTPPVLSITSPPDGASFAEGSSVNLIGTANDAEEGDLSADISWSSDLDGPLGTGASISVSSLSLGSHIITATVTDSASALVSEQISLSITPAQVQDSNILYRETFWTTNSSGNEPLVDIGWVGVNSSDGSVFNNFIRSNSIGKPVGLPTINAGNDDPGTAKEIGLLAAFNGPGPYFAFTEEYSIDLSSTRIDSVSWYQGHKDSNGATRVAVKIGSQWYVSSQSFTQPTLGSASLFQNADPGGAGRKVLPFSTAAADWVELNFTQGTALAIGNPASADLGGTIDGLGLYADGGNFTFRADNFTVFGGPDTTSGPVANIPPVVSNPLADQVALVGSAFSLSIPSNTFSDVDGSLAFPYTISSNGGNLPSWLTFDGANSLLSGTPDSADVGTLQVEVSISDDSSATVSDTFLIEVQLPPDDCSPISTLPCNQILVNTNSDFCLAWDSDEGALVDNAGAGIGFTMAMEPSAPLSADLPLNPTAPGYKPANLTLGGGTLTIAATKGIPFKDPSQSNNTNSLINGLGVGFNADKQNPYSIKTTINSVPSPGSSQFQQAGLWFGLGEADYIKFVINSNSGNTDYNVELLYEEDDLSPPSNSIQTSSNPVLDGDTVILKLEVDPNTLAITGVFSTDGGASFDTVGTLTVNSKIITGELLPDSTTGPVSFAGVHASIRNSATTLNFSFDEFCIDVEDNATAELDGNISLEGRTDYATAITVETYQNGANVGSYNVNTDAAGNFTVPGLGPGTYEVKVKADKYLAVLSSQTLTVGSNTASFGELKAGDVNGDNRVSSADFSVLAASFNLQAGEQGYEAGADFNGDGVVSSLDFSLLAGNFNTAGDEPTP